MRIRLEGVPHMRPGGWGPQGMPVTGGGPRGSQPACVQTPFIEVAHAGREGRINVLPWYRLVGVAETSSETQRRKSGAARKG